MGIEEMIKTPLLEGVEEGILELSPGRLVEMVGEPGSGLTRLGFRMLAQHSRVAPVVVVDTVGTADRLVVTCDRVLSSSVPGASCAGPELAP